MLLVYQLALFVLQGFGKVESVWPSSVTGYVGLTAAMISITVIIYDRITGRASNWRDIKNDIKVLCDRIEKEEAATKTLGNKLQEMDELLTGINFEIRGVAGDNGMRQSLRDIKIAIEAILVRNRAMDIKAGIFENMLKHNNYDGPERREVIRRAKDLLSDELG